MKFVRQSVRALHMVTNQAPALEVELLHLGRVGTLYGVKLDAWRVPDLVGIDVGLLLSIHKLCASLGKS